MEIIDKIVKPVRNLYFESIMNLHIHVFVNKSILMMDALNNANPAIILGLNSIKLFKLKYELLKFIL